MDTQIDISATGGAAAPLFVQVLYVGRSGGADVVEALRRDGVGVIVAFDCERAARLLRHFRPDAILCAEADASALQRYVEANVPVLTLPDDDRRRSTGHESSSMNAAAAVADTAAIAHRLREEIAVHRARVEQELS